MTDLKADRLRVVAMSSEYATAIATWQYEGPWTIYDGDGTADSTDDYWAVTGDNGELVGFYCTGAEARVPGLEPTPDVLDIGVGMHPALVGAGNGRAFAAVVLAHCRTEYREVQARAVVQSWNERSLRLAAGMGFEQAGVHTATQDGKKVLYTVLTARLGPAAESMS